MIDKLKEEVNQRFSKQKGIECDMQKLKEVMDIEVRHRRDLIALVEA
jgi:hypothetical protein